MSERLERISRLLSSGASRASYIRAKLNVLISSQIRALRLKRENMTQKQLATLAEMAQPRISAMERPGATKFNVETLVRLASALKVGLKVEFVPFSEMLAWENNFSQDQFDAVTIDNDRQFLNPVIAMQEQAIAQQSTIQLHDMLNHASALAAARGDALAGMGVIPPRSTLEASVRTVPAQAIGTPNMSQTQSPWSVKVSGTAQEKKLPSSEHNTFLVQGELANAASVGATG